MRQSKAAYKRLVGYIKHNTLNTVQGPTVGVGSVMQNVTQGYSTRQAKKALQAAKHNADIIHIHPTNELLLFESDRIRARIEEEATKENPSKDLIGHLNKCLMGLDQ